MKTWLCTAIFLSLFSCNYLPEAKPNAIARVNDVFLYEDDIADLIPEGTSKEDSITIVRNYIDRWASQKLMIKAAELNLSESKKNDYDALIRQYKIDLYTKGYLEDLVKSTVDTVVTEEELKTYYKENKENFRTNGMLVQLRYVHLLKDNPKFETIKNKFFDYRKSDKKFWETYALQFKSFAFNDSVWTDMSQVYIKLPFINPDNRDQYISAGKSAQHADSLATYLVKIRNVIDKGQIGPYEYLKPTLKEVILNKRKLELIKKIEKEITDDAIKDQKYEIYK